MKEGVFENELQEILKVHLYLVPLVSIVPTRPLCVAFTRHLFVCVLVEATAGTEGGDTDLSHPTPSKAALYISERCYC